MEKVVPYIGTWIETSSGITDLAVVGRTLYRYVDWNRIVRSPDIVSPVVPYIGTWIETNIKITRTNVSGGRTLYRYVDWNDLLREQDKLQKVVPYIGTWIETPDFINLKFEFWSYLI